MCGYVYVTLYVHSLHVCLAIFVCKLYRLHSVHYSIFFDSCEQIYIFVKGHTIYNIQYTCLFVMKQVCKYCFLFLIKTLSIFISKETSHKCGFNFTKVTSKPSQNPEKSLYLSLLKEYFFIFYRFL